ncbi:hypothetical protein APE_0151.1 [Aeropyrum pernix K1]|uniref:THUMP domain-containing protein n=1 Tax=Aeropyrum pernix (strain ATCC 700893 / DSM 11879 / JCM 9820 / NBRC 100138 / K1) TaxID=272557 RepID=Q9YFU9_AERPE|nr:hypothetical protein [Aeropyrum pernix]BAA79062.2 hypothetical protein APE_0151.1 [Aeropyrum pernix K1]
MSSEERMSECPVALVVAQPRRHTWALEEAWDLAVSIDPETSRAVETGYPGVILIYSGRAAPLDVARRAIAVELGFIQRVVPAVICGRIRESREAYSMFETALKILPAGVGKVLFISSLRGSSKDMVDVARLSEILARAGLKPVKRGAQEVVDVEGVDDILIISPGIIRKCGLRCIVVYPVHTAVK